MAQFSFKKLLSLLTALTVVSTASINIVACGNKNKANDLQQKSKNATKYTYYGVNDKYYYSKEEALDDQIQHNVTTTSEFDLLKDISLKEKSYQSLEQMYDAIAKDYDMTSISTKKDPKNYIVDAMGQLSPNVITEGLEQAKVYRDINGQVINGSLNNATEVLKQAQQSYLSQIERKYIVDDQYFDNKDDILSYYQNKYQTKNKLEQSTCYEISNSCVEENELKAILNRSLNFKFQYNGEAIDQSQIDDLSKINLTYEDESKIKKFSKSPGTFLIEKTDSAEGVLTGSTVFEAPDEIAEIVHDKAYWELKETESTSALEFLTGTVVSTGLSLVSQNQIYEAVLNNNDIEKSISCLGNPDGSLHLEDSIVCHTGKQESAMIDAFIKKYEIVGDFESVVSNLNQIETLDLPTKEKVMLYQLNELFRNTNITKEDFNKLKGIWKRYLLDLDKSYEWKQVVESFENEDVSALFEYLVNPSSLTNLQKHMSSTVFDSLNKSIINYGKKASKATSLALKAVDEIYKAHKDKINALIIKAADKFANIGVKAEQVATHWISNLAKFAKALPLVGIALDILDAISIQKSYTYQLRIPDTNVVLSYQFHKWAWQTDNFDPATFFRVLDIKKPSNSVKYLYEGRYYPSLEMAKKNMKLDIVDEIIKSGKATYYSNYYPSITADTKDKLITKLLTEAKKNPQTKYLDHFGESFSTSDAALDSMLAHLQAQSFNSIYTYRYGPLENNVFYEKDLKSIEEKVLKMINIESKTVLWTDLLTTTEFEKLEDISEFTYDIYQLNINGKAYYFNSQSEAIYYVMKIKSFKNIVTRVLNKTYTYKNQTFKTIESLQDYILTTIKTYTASTIKEVQDHVGY